MSIILDGKELSEQITRSLVIELRKICKGRRSPHLAVIAIGNNSSSEIYIRGKEKACKRVGIETSICRLKGNAKLLAVKKLIGRLNANKNIDAILLQLPLPSHLNEQTLLQLISPAKDVDCFHPYNAGMLILSKAKMAPCTPAGIMALFEKYKINCDGKNAVVVGRSNIVGKPISMMLLQKNATVTICHSHTKDLKEKIKKADILIAAVGRPKFIKGAWIKKGAVVIDVGINRLSDGKIVGDVEFDTAKKKAMYITPVPGGIGPMTIAMLLKNIITAYRTRE